MSSEEFRVFVSGPTVAFFLYEAVNRPTDFEGLLFGDYRRCVHREISDQSDAGDRNQPGTIIHDVYIRRVVPTGVKFSFYNRKFEANFPDYAGDVVKHLSSSSAANVGTSAESGDTVRSGFLGWFRYQLRPPVHSQSELMISRALCSPEALRKTFPPIAASDNKKASTSSASYFPWPGNGPFYIFSRPGVNNNILEWNIHLKSFNSTSAHFRPVRMQIRNLGDTTHADYWKLGGSGSTASASVAGLMPGLIPDGFHKMIVDTTDRMAENAKKQLSRAVDSMLTESQKIFDSWNWRGGTVTATDYVKYGYCPSSSEEMHSLLEHLESTVGTKQVPPAAAEVAESCDDENPISATSQKSADLFGGGGGDLSLNDALLLSENANTTGGEDEDEDKEMCNATAEGGWVTVQSTDVLEDELSGTNVPEQSVLGSLERQLEEMSTANANPSTRGCKRPKENTSSSSSGATSDDMPEPASSTVLVSSTISRGAGRGHSCTTTDITASLGPPPGLSITTTTKTSTTRSNSPSSTATADQRGPSQQQSRIRKKSKGGGSSEDSSSTSSSMDNSTTTVNCGPHSAAAAALPPAAPQQHRVRLPGPPHPPGLASPVAGGGSHMVGRGSPIVGGSTPTPTSIGKGRGHYTQEQVAKSVPPPPGFEKP